MAFEVKEVLEFQLGSVRKPKWEVKDLNGNTEFQITDATFIVKDKHGTTVMSGTCYVNNADTDAAGNTIKTVMPTLDFSDTDMATGFYSIAIRIYLDNGEDDTLKINIEVVNY